MKLCLLKIIYQLETVPKFKKKPRKPVEKPETNKTSYIIPITHYNRLKCVHTISQSDEINSSKVTVRSNTAVYFGDVHRSC